MKFYYFPVAPNPTRVRTYIGEKGISLEMIQVNLREGEQNQAQHLARNPRAKLPVLELDDGTCITESLPIIEYLEELHPEPPMIGGNALERVRTRELERMAEMNVLLPMGRLVHATNSPVGLPANPAVAAVEEAKLPAGMGLFNDILAGQPFVGGARPSIADCTLFAGLFFGEFFGVSIAAEHSDLLRWYSDFKERPSAQL